MKALQLTLGALSLVSLLTVGCGKNKVVATAEEFATKACACKDAKCAEDVTKEFATKAEESKDAMGTEADMKAIAAAGEKAMGCIMKLAPAGAPDVAAAPAADAK
jgi:hypothetical protein